MFRVAGRKTASILFSRPGVHALSLPTFVDHGVLETRGFRPVGSLDNSPAIYRWVRVTIETHSPGVGYSKEKRGTPQEW